MLAVIENDSWLFAGGFPSVTVRSLDADALAYGHAFLSEAPALVPDEFAEDAELTLKNHCFGVPDDNFL